MNSKYRISNVKYRTSSGISDVGFQISERLLDLSDSLPEIRIPKSEMLARARSSTEIRNPKSEIGIHLYLADDIDLPNNHARYHQTAPRFHRK